MFKYNELLKLAAAIFVTAFPAMFTYTAYAGVTAVTPVAENGIFQYGDDVAYTVEYDSAQENEIDIALTDYFGEMTSFNSVAPDNEISLGKLDTGWYRINMQQSGKTVYSATLSVVPDPGEFPKDTPFATDLAANAILKNKSDASKYARAARLAGRSWVRERYNWQKNANGSYNYGDFESVVNAEAAEGLNVLAVFHNRQGSPSSREALTGDLREVYDFQYKTADRFRGRVQGWEIWNEPDLDTFARVPADVYSAFFKAAALGVRDADETARVSFGSLCKYPYDSPYSEIMMKNGVMRYSDTYSIHLHKPAAWTSVQSLGTDFITDHINMIPDSDKSSDIWMTEAGLAMTSVTDTMLKKQARYAVSSCAESVSAGVDKHFWFILPAYKEGQKYYYGVMDDAGYTYPAYASMAVMASVLGKAEYKGRLNNSDVNGYVFENDGRDILVLWSSSAKTVALSDTGDIKIYGLMGREEKVSSAAGKVILSSGNDPKYIVFENGMKASEYTAAPLKEKAAEKALSRADRIVIRADYNEKYIESARDHGYVFSANEARKVDVNIYNFNDSAVSGTIRCAADGFSVSGVDKEITIDAHDMMTVPVTLVPDGTVVNKKSGVSFYLETEYGSSTPAAADTVVFDNTAEEKIGLSGVINGGSYNSLDTAVFTVPGGAESIIVRLDNSQPEVSVSGNEISVDLSQVTDGAHTLMLSAKYSDGTIYVKRAGFILREKSIVIEGEALGGIYDGCKTTSYSGIGCASYMSASEPELAVKFYAPRAGKYEMSISASLCAGTFNTSPYELALNGERIEAQQDAQGSVFAEYSAEVYLVEGINELTFAANAKRVIDSRYFLYLDSISFMKLRDNDESSGGLLIEAEKVAAITKNGESIDDSESGFAILTETKEGIPSGDGVLRVNPKSAARPLMLTYDIDVESSGEYMISIDRGVCDNSYLATGYIEIGGKSIEMSDKNVNRLLSESILKLSEGNVPIYRYRLNDTVTLEAGHNTVSILLDAAPAGRSDDRAWLVMDKIVLEKVIDSARLSLGGLTLSDGETARVEISDADGEQCPIWMFDNVHCGTSDPSVATVDEDGYVTATGAGECEISISLEYNGIRYMLSAPVSVSGNASGIVANMRENGDGTAEVIYTSIRNTDREPVTIICARHEDGVLNAIGAVSSVIPARYLCVDKSVTVDGKGELSAYIWSGLNDQIPMTDKIELN